MTIAPQTLANGLRVANVRMPSASSCALSLCIRGGSAYETEATAGIAHVVEHALFRGLDAKTRWHLDRAADHEATTGPEAVYIDLTGIAPGDLDAAIGLLGRIVCSPSISAAELAAEREVMAQELREQWYDDAGELTDLVLLGQREAFGRSGVGLPPAGLPGGVARVSLDDVAAWHAAHVTGTNVAIAAAGPIEPDATLDAIERAFAGLPPGVPLVPPPTSLRTAQGPRVRIVDGHIEGDPRPPARARVEVALCFVAPIEADPTADAVEMLDRILRLDDSGPLYQALRGSAPLAYSYEVNAAQHAEACMLSIEVPTSIDRVGAMADAVLALLDRIADQGPALAELALARAGVERELRDVAPADVASMAAEALLLGGPLDYGEQAEALLEVTSPEIRDVAAELIQPRNLIGIVAGPVRESDVRAHLMAWRAPAVPEPIDPEVVAERARAFVADAQETFLRTGMQWAGDSWLRKGLVVAGAVKLASVAHGKPRRPQTRARRRG